MADIPPDLTYTVTVREEGLDSGSYIATVEPSGLSPAFGSTSTGGSPYEAIVEALAQIVPERIANDG